MVSQAGDRQTDERTDRAAQMAVIETDFYGFFSKAKVNGKDRTLLIIDTTECMNGVKEGHTDLICRFNTYTFV